MMGTPSLCPPYGGCAGHDGGVREKEDIHPHSRGALRPSFASFSALFASQRAKTAASELFSSLLKTRSEAIKRNANVTVSPLTGATESQLLESAADLYQAGDLWAVNVALQSRADVALAGGDVQRARELFQDSLELATRQSDTREYERSSAVVFTRPGASSEEIVVAAESIPST